MDNSLESQLNSGGGAGSAALSLNTIIAVIRKRKWVMLAITLFVPAVTFYLVSKEAKIYETSASIVIESSVPQYLGSNFRDVVDVEGNWWSSQETLQTEQRVIRSLSQGAAVAKALCAQHVGNSATPALLMLDPTAHCDSPEDLRRLAPMLAGMVRVEPVKDSRVVNLVVVNGNPELAAVIANTYAQVYVDRNLARRMEQSQDSATWLGEQSGDLGQKLNEAEHQLIDFKRRNNVVAVAIEDQQNETSSRRKKLSDELDTVEVKLITLRAQQEQYMKLKGNDPTIDLTAGGGAESPVMMKLKELYVDQYAKLLEMRGKYLEKHPAVLAQESRVNSIREDLVRESGLAIKSVDSQLAMLQRQEHELRAAVQVGTGEAIELERKAIEYNRLKRNFDRLVKLSEQVGGREGETSLAGHLKTNNVRTLDPALVPVVPIAPNVMRAVSSAFFVGLLLAIGLAVLLELLDLTVKTQDDVERAAGLPFLGLIPTIKDDEATQLRPDRKTKLKMPDNLAPSIEAGSKDLWIVSHPKSQVAECFRHIRTNLLFMTPDTPARTLLVTSAGPQEGKTTTAVNLAISMAQSGLRVVIVDTDMRRPRLHKAFGMTSSTEGVSKAVVGEARILDVVRDTGVENLWMVPCGAIPPNPAELLHSDRFKAIVKELSEHFDRVIFDSPPVGAVTDAAILSRLTSGTILVAKGGRTSKEALRRAHRSLSDGGVNILGCIINDLDLEKLGRYGSHHYYYYSRYGYYYGARDEDVIASGGGKPPAESAPN